MSGSAGTPVRIEVVDILGSGSCPLGLERGRVWEVRDGFLPERMCSSAWTAIQHYVFALRSGGAMPWDGSRRLRACCPDSADPVVFEIAAVEG